MKVCLLFISLISPLFLFAQDVESEVNSFKNRWQKDPLKLSSSIGLNSTYYGSNNTDSYRITFGYNIFGNINFDFLGIQAPLGFFYSNQNSQFNLPSYRFVGISPVSYTHLTLPTSDLV